MVPSVLFIPKVPSSIKFLTLSARDTAISAKSVFSVSLTRPVKSNESVTLSICRKLISFIVASIIGRTVSTIIASAAAWFPLSNASAMESDFSINALLTLLVASCTVLSRVSSASFRFLSNVSFKRSSILEYIAISVSKSNVSKKTLF